MRDIYSLTFLILFATAQGQNSSKWQFNFQETTVFQGHPKFDSTYSGLNSLSNKAETKTTMTATFFLARKLWKNGYFFINPEMAGGEGISEARGIAGFTNGESFRVGDPKPVLYLARYVYHQYFALSDKMIAKDRAQNQFADSIPEIHIHLVLGKFCIADYFDLNGYCHDPRSQFLNWSLMSNGAWDYPANTRGYTQGGVLEFASPQLSARFAATLVPKTANGPELDSRFGKANALQLELEKKFKIANEKLTARLVVFRNTAPMLNYMEVVPHIRDTAFNMETLRKDGHTKQGIGLNLETTLGENAGAFLRASWNDGKNETWAFTEIDQSVSIGYSSNGTAWKRPQDKMGIAFVSNGLSTEHRTFLANGGYGFIIGDGRLPNYGMENILEVFYNWSVTNNIFASPDYQFVMNPAYNKDRGPVHVLTLRAHFEF